MRRGFALIPLAVLAACSQEPEAVSESADDYADRIGQPADVAVSSDAVAAKPVAATALEPVGDISAVAFGPRSGACSFSEGGREILVASALQEPTLPGKAVIRVNGALATLDSAPGGLEAIAAGTSFTGEGVTVVVAPAAGAASSRPADVTVTLSDGTSTTYSGNWNCA